jgi:hypothetical protein
MRFATTGIVLLASASWGSVSAQATTFGRRPSSVQSSFQVGGFHFSSTPLRLNKAPVQRIDLAATSGPVVFTCPMPVAHTNSAEVEPMPVARGGATAPMPVARSGCSNPLDPSH